MKRFIAVAVLGMAIAAAAGEAKAQFIVNGPDGSIGIRNPNGSYTYVYPERLNPAANVALPGSNVMTPNGNVWVGADGIVHGNLVDPSTGDVHLKSPGKPNSGSTKRTNPTPRPRPFTPRPVYRR